MAGLPKPLVDDMVRNALLEDLGLAGDVTSSATLTPDMTARAVFKSRQDGVLCGLAFARSAFRQTSDECKFSALLKDGDGLSQGEVIATVEGSARDILTAERTALNFMTHLSGVATATKQYANAVSHTDAKVTCTRKTLPGLRAAQKYAVRMGGGVNHRFGLDDAILIKDNHIAVCGGVVEAARAARAEAGHLMAIEIEVDTLDQLAALLDLEDYERPDAILLDNMAPETLKQAVSKRDQADGKRPVLEASGGITLSTIAAVAETGVDYISSGWLTASAPAIDIGLDIKISS
ncbi:MAG: carboxylating nicotinate-nucleotide diphosphorylase [Pseudomonadota bacterium]